ncbi:gamma-interferon-responsive lysosomal thiol protein-like [Macadamia integrifolia]|uniref:gamma-interferon-responsive lysosomal thiol protein-like n=1 Tax=Macadamia integrifolia TaxID=60698 RepID=UPI001C4E4A91|nr:gamma-interferon-responsive lysosomal thiol protein-like [Macadamia integrifolia]
MASLRFSSLLLLSCIFVFASARDSPNAPAPKFSRAYAPAPKVSLAVYYQTLCPSCSSFILNNLSEAFDNGLINILDIKLVPFGNAKIHGNDTITCQHGPDECFLNTVEACAIDVWPNLYDHFTFISCVEELSPDVKYIVWQSCFRKLNLDPRPILACSHGRRGKELELKYGKITGSLRPPLEFVPWVTVNNQPLFMDYEGYTSYVCNAYQGTAVPRICKSGTYLNPPREMPSPAPGPVLHEVVFGTHRL